MENHAGYVASGSDRKGQSKFHNFVNPYLLAGEPDDLVLGIINVPKLHLIIGVVDKHLTGLENVFGKDWVDQYLKQVYIIRKSYQGGHALEGNQASEFLKKLPHLERKIMDARDELKVEGLELLESLRCFRKVQEACFGQDLRDNYEHCIKKFSKTYRGLNNMSITPKIHIVERHIIDFFRDREDNHGE